MSSYFPMIRSAPRLLFRSSNPLIRPLRPQRQFSLAPPSQRSRSWRNVTIRWGLAICGIYYYNTSNVFAEEPISTIPSPSSSTEDTSVETLESLAAARRQSKDAPSNPSIPSNNPPDSLSHPSPEENPSPLDQTAEEASQQGAFNEETGEINWDCPCLGGMAHGPCGEEFRASFSCFVFSKEDPKGMDCIDHFKNMQDCFRQHPEIYGSEMDDDDDGHEGDTELSSPRINDDSASSRPSAGDKLTPSIDQADHQTETNPPSPFKSAPSHPQVDESLRDSQHLPDSPQPSSSALKPASPHERSKGSESSAAPNLLQNAEPKTDEKLPSTVTLSS